MSEIWRDVVGFEGIYQVSNKGHVRNIKTNNRLKGNHTKGYRYVVLCKDKKQFSPKVHRLVAEAFIDNPNKYKCINHIDGVKTNNCVENLEWCTYSHNTLHSYRLGLQKKQYGSNNHMHMKYGKLNAKSKSIIMKSLNGYFIVMFESVELAVKWLQQNGYPKANSSSISLCARGIKYKKAYGFIWEYEKEDYDADKIIES